MRSLKLLGLAILCGQTGAYLRERLALHALKSLYRLGWTPIELILYLEIAHDLPSLEEYHG